MAKKVCLYITTANNVKITDIPNTSHISTICDSRSCPNRASERTSGAVGDGAGSGEGPPGAADEGDADPGGPLAHHVRHPTAAGRRGVSAEPVRHAREETRDDWPR